MSKPLIEFDLRRALAGDKLRFRNESLGTPTNFRLLENCLHKCAVTLRGLYVFYFFRNGRQFEFALSSYDLFMAEPEQYLAAAGLCKECGSVLTHMGACQPCGKLAADVIRELLRQRASGEYHNAEGEALSPAEKRAQRISFAFGNTSLGNVNVTREMVEAIHDEMYGAPDPVERLLSDEIQTLPTSSRRRGQEDKNWAVFEGRTRCICQKCFRPARLNSGTQKWEHMDFVFPGEEHEVAVLAWLEPQAITMVEVNAIVNSCCYAFAAASATGDKDGVYLTARNAAFKLRDNIREMTDERNKA